MNESRGCPYGKAQRQALEEEPYGNPDVRESRSGAIRPREWH